MNSEEKENTAFAYTLSSRNKMVQQCLRSIATLKHYVSEEQIKIFYTPPYNDEDEQALKETGAEIIKKENQTEAFNVSRSQPERHYGEKINLCSIEKENVVFLDCDTVVGNNIWEVVEGEFEFKARPGKIQNEEKWREVFNENNEKYLDWKPNAGFMIFKNRKHKQIKEKWREYIRQDLDTGGSTNTNEQDALALAVSQLNIEKMNERDHVMEWRGEKEPGGTIYHLDQSHGSKAINIIKNMLKKTPI